MSTKRKMSYALVITMLIIFFIMLLTIPSSVGAKQKENRMNDMRFNVNDYMMGNLKYFIGKTISITLQSGKTFTGIVKDVGKYLVHLEQLEGKEYFDALIKIEDISAIEARFKRNRR